MDWDVVLDDEFAAERGGVSNGCKIGRLPGEVAEKGPAGH